MQPVNIEFPPAKAGWQQSEEEGASLKDVSTEQAKIIRKMVLDKKTNKEIAETTGLKYWEVTGWHCVRYPLGAMEEGRCKCPRILREGDTKFYRFEVIKNIFDDERCGKNETD